MEQPDLFESIKPPEHFTCKTTIEHCRCRFECPTTARVTKWSCGCVEVWPIMNPKPGIHCSDFLHLAHKCKLHPGKNAEEESEDA